MQVGTRQALNDDSFRIVVVGEFARGKSTVVNALLGDRVLPSSVLPSTAVLTRIRHAEFATFRLSFPDDRPGREISHQEFIQLVAPPEPIPGDQASLDEYETRIAELRSIDHVDVTYPSPLCRNGVEIIDTPGTNGLDPLHEKITYEFLPKADAIIFVLSAKMFLAQTELDFLSNRIFKEDIQRIFFVVNFADHLRSDSDRQKVLARGLANLAPLAGDPKLFLICAKAALAHRRMAHGVQTAGTELMPYEKSGIIELEQDLSQFLSRERGWTKLCKPVAHGLRLVNELRNGPLAIARSSVGVELPELQSRIAKLQPELRWLEAERDRVGRSLRVAMVNHGRDLFRDVERGMEAIAELAATTVGGYLGPLREEDLAHAIEASVAPAQTEFQCRMQDRQERILQDECGRAQRKLESAWKDLYLSIEKVFKKTASVHTGVARTGAKRPIDRGAVAVELLGG